MISKGVFRVLRMLAVFRAKKRASWVKASRFEAPGLSVPGLPGLNLIPHGAFFWCRVLGLRLRLLQVRAGMIWHDAPSVPHRTL